MQAVIGIGNPGVKYVNTKHNAGFIIIDRFLEKNNLIYKTSKSNYLFVEGKFRENDFLIVRPTTYVNNSGLAVLDICDNHNISVENLLVVVDDINLEMGHLRIRKNGGSGGHNGLESIIYHLQSQNFPRIRFGIGAEFKEGFQADYVLSKFSTEELTKLEPNFDFAVELIEKFLIGGNKEMTDHFSKFSNKINQKEPPHEREEN